MTLREIAQQQTENVVKMDNMLVIAAGAALSPLLTALYGERGTDMMILVMGVLILDLVTGTLAAKKEQIETSEYGLKGIIRIGVISVIPALAHRADLMVGMGNMMFYALTVGIMYHTLKSFGANSVRLGWDKFIPLPVVDYIVGLLETELRSKMARSQEQFGRLNNGQGEQPLSPTMQGLTPIVEEAPPVQIDLDGPKG